MAEASNTHNTYRIYKGGKSLEQVQMLPAIDHPDGYKAPEGLIDAVNVAILLGKPLLITGEPGTGKTQLAYSIANDLKLGPMVDGLHKPYKFVAKHNSLARDLLYTYNSLQHFSEANQAKAENRGLEKTAADFITFQALGEAIRGADKKWMEQQEDTPHRSVVLIDEIDKAPREFPNDLLSELENMAFEVPEIPAETYGQEGTTHFQAERAMRPIVVITSNGEKNLPDAFLRRCVFFHIPFPSEEKLLEIVRTRLYTDAQTLRFDPNQELPFLIQHFQTIRELCQKKKPATSDLLSWLQILDYYKELDVQQLNFQEALTDGERDLLMTIYTVLVKNQIDRERVLNSLPSKRNE
ncbi:MAG: MoxR family ATPase [Bacteroidota bacterium]